MMTDHSLAEQSAVGRTAEASAMPPYLKRAIALVTALAVIAAVMLFVGRGSAFVVDLYSMVGLGFCT
jgi:hypothetical protein